MSLIARHLDRYLTICCHENSVTSLRGLESEAPLDANEAAQFTSTTWAMFPAQIKQRDTTFLQEEQPQKIICNIQRFKRTVGKTRTWIMT